MIRFTLGDTLVAVWRMVCRGWGNVHEADMRVRLETPGIEFKEGELEL